jgi:hypothetical protein
MHLAKVRAPLGFASRSDSRIFVIRWHCGTLLVIICANNPIAVDSGADITQSISRILAQGSVSEPRDDLYEDRYRRHPLSRVAVYQAFGRRKSSNGNARERRLMSTSSKFFAGMLSRRTFAHGA